ncbi:MAG: prepilin-type N-terminal cleavage/methylation domain-containing protein [Desulfobulbales bacterium]|nr:prepilin-type N-terminal cleavage/methylation domain-containing protein [Desulfobulbales bacterium]
MFALEANFPQPLIRKIPGNARGYTLIELIVVIVILGLVFGLTVPKFKQAVSRDSLDSSVLRIIGLVEDLRESAISNQVSYLLNFDLREKKLWAFASNVSEEEQEHAKERAARLPDDVEIEDIWTWTNGRLYEEATIRFSKKGYIEQSMIHLESEDGRQLTLELTPFLGSIIIHEGYVLIDR